MGCTASKLDNEDTVRRCKDRRRFMKQAVHARHQLAAALSDYCRCLRLTGSVLSSFAAGEPLSVSDQTPAVFLHPPPEHSSTDPIPPRAPPSPSPSSVHPPPPPPPLSPSIASSKLPHILSASSDRHRKLPPKLPHILSESSPSSPTISERSNFAPNFFPTAFQNSTYSTTPSQASSVWNWENFYPPSPPDSEFFNRKARETQQNLHHLSNDLADGDDTETERSEYDFFQARKQKQFESMNNTVGEETEREEVQCSEWEDHDQYSTTSSSEVAAEDEGEDRESMSEIGKRSDFGSSSLRTSSMKRHHQQPPLPRQEHGGAAQGKYDKADDATTSSDSYRGGREIADLKMVFRHKDLKEIVDAIKENFDKAAAAGDQVSKMLEIGRAQLDHSFSQFKSEFDLPS